MIPTAEHNLPVREHGRIHLMTLVKRNLVDAGAIRVHDMQQERRLIIIFVKGCELRLQFI